MSLQFRAGRDEQIERCGSSYGSARLEVKRCAVKGECRARIVACTVDRGLQIHGRAPRIPRCCARGHPQIEKSGRAISWPIGREKDFQAVAPDGGLTIEEDRTELGDQLRRSEDPIGEKDQELRRRAAAHLRRERRDHTLQPTALVNEAYLRLVAQHAPWQNRQQFFCVASQIMCRVLVDRARARGMAKRSGQWARVTLDDARAMIQPVDIDLLDLDAALTQLAAFDPRKSQIAELRFFGGLSLDETGKALGVSLATVERDWQAARAWLFKTLSGHRNHDT